MASGLGGGFCFVFPSSLAICIFVFFTLFDLFMQLSYPILRIFGEEDGIRWLTEDHEGLVESFLPGRPEVRKLRHSF